MQTLSEIIIDLYEIEDGLKLFIDSEKSDALFLNEANNNYEAKFQIQEGCFYDYTFSKKGYRLKCLAQKNIVSKRKRDKHTGQISPNIYVGKFDQIKDAQSPLNFFDVDYKKYPNAKEAYFMDATLSAGDCLYVPAYYYI